MMTRRLIHFPDKLYSGLKEEAAKEGMKRSKLIRKICQTYLEHKGDNDGQEKNEENNCKA